MITMLEHAPVPGRDDCTRSWRLDRLGPVSVIRCTGCRAMYVATRENREAAIEENYAGIWLRRLSVEGERKAGEP